MSFAHSIPSSVDDEFKNAITAIYHDDFSELERVMRTSPTAFLQADGSGNTLLHHAVLSGMSEIMEIVIRHLQRIHALEWIASLVDRDGNNPLHLAVAQNLVDCVAVLLNGLGAAAAMALVTTNNAGKTPPLAVKKIQTSFLSFFGETKDEKNAREIKESLLRAVIQTSPSTGLSPALEKQDLVQRYPEAKHNPILSENLELGCKAMQLAVQDAPDSYTHARVNQYKPEEKKELFQRFAAMNSELHYEKDFDRKVEIIKSHRIANCYAYSILAASHLARLNNNKRIEEVSFKNGDHSFLVYDRPAESDLNNPSTWGNAVIIDTLNGATYPAAAYMNAELRDYQHLRYGENTYN